MTDDATDRMNCYRDVADAAETLLLLLGPIPALIENTMSVKKKNPNEGVALVVMLQKLSNLERTSAALKARLRRMVTINHNTGGMSHGN